METLIGFLGAALALLAVFVLYLGGTAIVLRIVERLSSMKNARLKDTVGTLSST